MSKQVIVQNAFGQEVIQCPRGSRTKVIDGDLRIERLQTVPYQKLEEGQPSEAVWNTIFMAPRGQWYWYKVEELEIAKAKKSEPVPADEYDLGS